MELPLIHDLTFTTKSRFVFYWARLDNNSKWWHLTSQVTGIIRSDSHVWTTGGTLRPIGQPCVNYRWYALPDWTVICELPVVRSARLDTYVWTTGGTRRECVKRSYIFLNEKKWFGKMFIWNFYWIRNGGKIIEPNGTKLEFSFRNFLF